jgi:formate hydrogenlyase transcriptional activator
MGRRIDTIPAAVLDALVDYPWPGNIREMQNVIERAVILSPGRSLQVPSRNCGPRGSGVRSQGTGVRSQRGRSLGS